MRGGERQILLCGDKKYIKYCGVTLTSILESNGSKFSFYIFCDAIEDDDLEKLNITAQKYKVSISVCVIDEELLSMLPTDTNGNTHISIAAYFRFIAYEALSKIIDRVLYLDSDIIVRGDINFFWKKVLSKNCIAAVIKDDFASENERRIGVFDYFNSGVMFVDLKSWSKFNGTEKCFEKLKEGKWRFLDQDILNLVLNNNKVIVDKKFNYQYSLSRQLDKCKKPSLDRLPENAVIVHFIGASKPWHSWVQIMDAVKQYNVIKDMSEWKDNKIINPDDIDKQCYKYWHKAARLARKEGDFIGMIYDYCKYAYNKLRLK